MRYLIMFRADHSVYLFLFAAYLFSVSHGKMTMSASPPKPVVNQRCVITCTFKNFTSLRIIIYKSYTDLNDVQNILWTKTTNTIDYGSEKWRNRRDLSVDTDPEKGSLSLSFNVKTSDRRQYQCLSVTPLSQKFVKLDVQRPPSVLGLYLAHMNKTKRTEVLPGETVLVICDLQLGVPKSMPSSYEFSAPGEAVGDLIIGEEKKDAFAYSNRTLQLKRRVSIADNAKPIRCSASNTQGRADETLAMNVTFPVEKVVLSPKPNANITAGEVISCSAQGNPPPLVTIQVRNAGKQLWARRGAKGYSVAKLRIPENANLTRYDLACSATNVVAGKRKTQDHPGLTIRVVGPTMGNIGLYAGVVAAALLLVIIIAIIIVVRRRSSGEAKPERNSELDKGSGRYDIEVMEKSGCGPQSYGTRLDPMRGGDRYDGSNGGSPCGGGDEDAGESLELSKLHYATLDLEDTPRSRQPIIFEDDQDRVEYSEIVPSLSPLSAAFDEDHLYENVRHHDV